MVGSKTDDQECDRYESNNEWCAEYKAAGRCPAWLRCQQIGKFGIVVAQFAFDCSQDAAFGPTHLLTPCANALPPGRQPLPVAAINAWIARLRVSRITLAATNSVVTDLPLLSHGYAVPGIFCADERRRARIGDLSELRGRQLRIGHQLGWAARGCRDRSRCE
jgi:hypothetical protein